jgi:hypothetical protein
MSLKNGSEPLVSVFRGIVDNIPPKWRARLGVTRIVQKQPLDIGLTELGEGVVASQLVQEQTNERTKTDTTISDPTGETLVEYIRTKDGQVGTRIIKLVPAGSPLPTFTELTVDAGQENFGNGWSEQMVVTTPNLFGGNDYSIEIRDVIPPEFLTLIQTKDEAVTIAGTAAMPTLVLGDLRREEVQLTEQTKRVSRRYRDLTTTPTLIDKDTNREKQVVTITKSLVADTTTPILPTAIRDTKFEHIGAGLAVQTQITIDAIFVGAVYEKSILNLIPETFRAFVPQRKHDFTVTGAVSTDPPLAVGDLSRKETQTDEFNKRVEIASIDTVEIPKTKVDKGLTREFGGSETNIFWALNVQGSLDVETGTRVLNSEVTRLGNGYEIRKTERGIDDPWTELHGQEYDERFDVLIPFDLQVKDADTDLGVARTEVKPIDKWREESKTIDIDAVAEFLDNYSLSYFGKVNVDMPDKLVSVSSDIATDRGEGTGDETGTFAFTGAYSVSQALSATAQSSSSMIPEVVAEIKQFWGNNIGCTNYHFFLPSPVTPAAVLAKIVALVGGAVSAWPKFNPEMVSFRIYGGGTRVQVKASSQGSSAASSSGTSNTSGGGTTYSRDQSLTVKSMRISPTIHDEITVSGATSDTDSVSATASAEAVGLGPPETETQSSTVNSSVTPTSIPATAGATDWPTTGKYLLRVDAQPYRFGYIQIHAVVVDAADFPINP